MAPPALSNSAENPWPAVAEQVPRQTQPQELSPENTAGEIQPGKYSPKNPLDKIPRNLPVEDAMKLQGSCHCRAVRFSVQSPTPVPYMLCYCSICRKTNGGGGYAINLSGDAETMKVEGREHLKIYQAVLEGAQEGDEPQRRSPGQRYFCGLCGSGLWVADPRWPELVHPFASAIDSPLPTAPRQVHMMESYRPDWAVQPARPEDEHFQEYPDVSIHDWHAREGLLED